MFNALILDDFELTEGALLGVLARKAPYRRFDGTHICNQFFIFFDGLASFALLPKRSKRKFRMIASNSMKQLTVMSRRGSLNCAGMLQLLKAERMALRHSNPLKIRNPSSWQASAMLGAVKKSYDNAISQLSRSGFFHFSAYANERIGLFMLKQRDQFWAHYYLNRATGLYRDWGASIKVQMLASAHSLVQLEDVEDNFVENQQYSVRARTRYDSMFDSVANLVSEEAQSKRSSSELFSESGPESQNCSR